MKPYTTIQLNVKVDDTTADQIKRLAAFNQITVAEQLRRFIGEGLSVSGNTQHIDLIASIIRQELTAIYHPADIQHLVAGQLEETLQKFENPQRKSGKTSAAGYFLLLKVLMYLTGNLSAEDFAQMAEQAGRMGVEFMKQSNSTINEILQDGNYACGTAANL
ncbi:MAG: hypothetical protein QM657_00245 [Lacrimispora sp.]|uniref:hypothetical protein n=1 Tax=Lacrimispora sp. TaxID=2719234 RepID=UPI0039E2769A